ncbi:MAG: hypothetical protein DWQ04_33330 [Chloroflexi bacterium]|nr:MAG: hypothetical protein DWQ04_33330 [Chloroflexota bacterium]
MNYQAYLLRIWRDPASKKDVEWRIVLQSVQSDEKIVLHSLEELIQFLRKNSKVEMMTDKHTQGD